MVVRDAAELKLKRIAFIRSTKEEAYTAAEADRRYMNFGNREVPYWFQNSRSTSQFNEFYQYRSTYEDFDTE